MAGIILQLRNPTAGCNLVLWEVVQRLLLNRRKKAIPQFIGNKTQGRISKWVFQENKARQIFQKMSISYPLILTRTDDTIDV